MWPEPPCAISILPGFGTSAFCVWPPLYRDLKKWESLLKGEKGCQNKDNLILKDILNIDLRELSPTGVTFKMIFGVCRGCGHVAAVQLDKLRFNPFNSGWSLFLCVSQCN